MLKEFVSFQLNEAGVNLANSVAQSFNQLLVNLIDYGLDGREFAIVKTKLEEACFYAKKSVALASKYQSSQPDNFEKSVDTEKLKITKAAKKVASKPVEVIKPAQEKSSPEEKDDLLDEEQLEPGIEIDESIPMGVQKYDISDKRRAFATWLSQSGYSAPEKKEKLKNILKQYISSDLHDSPALVACLHEQALDPLMKLIPKLLK